MLLGPRKSRTVTPLWPHSAGFALEEAPQLGFTPTDTAGTGKKRLPGEGITSSKASSLLRAHIIALVLCRALFPVGMHTMQTP